MGMKGFYFSLDAILSLLLMATVGSLILTSLNQPGIEAKDVKFSQYNAQANDLANYMQKRKAKSLEPGLKLSKNDSGDLKISRLIAIKHEENSDLDQDIVNETVKGEKYPAKVYIKSDQKFNEIYSGKSGDFADSSSAKILAVGDQKVHEILVVVGE